MHAAYSPCFIVEGEKFVTVHVDQFFWSDNLLEDNHLLFEWILSHNDDEQKSNYHFKICTAVFHEVKVEKLREVEGGRIREWERREGGDGGRTQERQIFHIFSKSSMYHNLRAWFSWSTVFCRQELQGDGVLTAALSCCGVILKRELGSESLWWEKESRRKRESSVWGSRSLVVFRVFLACFVFSP